MRRCSTQVIRAEVLLMGHHEILAGLIRVAA